MHKIKKIIIWLTPHWILSIYHYTLARIASLVYGFPSRKMVVIGVTGTKGKTSAINFIWASLSAGGNKTGIVSTANIRIGEQEFVNKYHMTMPGRFIIQKIMKDMVRAGCKYCIIETTSEGMKQFRHIGIAYDYAVFTNLTPEHLPSHGGSFEKYKKAKNTLFRILHRLPRKVLNGKKIPKIIIVNNDSEYAPYFAENKADKIYSYGIDKNADYQAKNVMTGKQGVFFDLGQSHFHLAIHGSFNVYNALPAIIIARVSEVSDADIAKGLTGLTIIPGRMEVVSCGQPFTVFVDYAHEKESMTRALVASRGLCKEEGKVIVVLGAEGGGRDKSKRALMGAVVARYADFVVVSDVDPYDDDPKTIIEDIAKVAEIQGKVRGKNLFTIEDRREGINKAL
ncbi:MAG: UDP-N-acetylmuramyl-tripeptide synthetase, partial [Candidatus Paceibacterota bacterium]